MQFTIGEKIRNARKRKMTQAELAHEIGVHEMTIRRWELGDRVPNVESLKKIAKVLNVPFSELVDVEDENNVLHINKQQDSKMAKDEFENSENVLFFKNGNQEIRLIDNDKNRVLFAQIVGQMINSSVKPVKTHFNIQDGHDNNLTNFE